MTLTNGNSTMLLYGGLDGADQTVTDIWIFEPDPIIRDLARNVQTGPYSKEERVLNVPNLWKKWNSDFTTRSWRLCPESQHCRMWHTASYNQYSGEFMIVGGATKQQNDEQDEDETLSEHILTFRVSIPSLVHCSSSRVRDQLAWDSSYVPSGLKKAIPYFGFVFDNERQNVERELFFLIKTFEENIELRGSNSLHMHNLLSPRRYWIALERRQPLYGRQPASNPEDNYLHLQIDTYTSLYVRARQLKQRIRGFSDLVAKFDEYLSPLFHAERTSNRFWRLYNDEFHGVI